MCAERRPRVPRANVLANVTAEDPIDNAGAQFARHFITQFNREVTDAPRGVEYIRLRKRLGRTSIEACAAGSAMIGFMRRVVVQLNIGQQCRKEKPAAYVSIKQQRVLTDP